LGQPVTVPIAERERRGHGDVPGASGFDQAS